MAKHTTDAPNLTASGPYHESDLGYLQHWKKVGAKLEEIRRQEIRDHGPKPYDWRIVDSLLQLGYLHGDRNPPTGFIEWQKRIAAAYASRVPGKNLERYW